jgi:hypothetical protein
MKKTSCLKIYVKLYYKKTCLDVTIVTWLLGCYPAKKVTIVVKGIPGNTPRGALLFVAGNFNVFDPGDQNYMLKRNTDSTYSITLPRGSGKISYKFTRGDWTTVERDGCGNEQPYRVFNWGRPIPYIPTF